MSDMYNWPVKRLTRRRSDHYPHLRRRGIVDPKTPGLSRRSRMISMALLRSNRRWDTYADKVRIEELPWEESKDTEEWRFVTQNGKLIQSLRRLSESTKERHERLRSIRDSEVPVSQLWIHKGDLSSRRDSGIGE